MMASEDPKNVGYTLGRQLNQNVLPERIRSTESLSRHNTPREVRRLHHLRTPTQTRTPLNTSELCVKYAYELFSALHLS